MDVFLIHGMGRSSVSMLLLSARLRRAGHRPFLFGYSVALESLDAIVRRLSGYIESSRGDGAEPYAIVGHSLGNIITRLATGRLPSGFARFVMLAPPNRPPTLARLLRKRWLFRTLTGDAGQRLGDASFYEALGRPDVPTCIIAGNAGPRVGWSPFGERAHDGVVAVDETRIEGVEHYEIPAIHTFIMNDRAATERTLRFLAET